MSKKARTQHVKVRDVVVGFSPLIINKIIGTPSDITDIFEDFVQHTPYQAIRYTLLGPLSTAYWDRHAYRGFHQIFPFG